MLVSHGRRLTRAMDRERVTPDELFTEMRRSGIDQLEHVRWAVLEPDGHISILGDAHRVAGVRLSEQRPVRAGGVL